MTRLKGFKHSEETKNKIGKANMGHSTSLETRLKISKSNMGRKIWNKGRAWTVEERKKISLTNKRKGIEPKVKFLAYGKNHPSWRGGKPKCLDCNKQLTSYKATRCSKCRFIFNRGDKIWNWKGGVRTEHQKIRGSVEFKRFRNAVFARDNYICQKYKIKGGKLHPHHIKNFAQYPELRFDVNNGITLSEKAHIEFHKIYGKKNNTREQLDEFLNQ